MFNKKISNINNNQELFSVPNSNTLLYIFSCLAIIVIITIFIGNYAFKNGQLTCDHYVFNTYLYIILAFMIMILVVLLNDKTGYFNFMILWLYGCSIIQLLFALLIFFIIIIGLTYLLININPKNILVSNLIWLLLVLLFGILLIPAVWLGRLFNVVTPAILITICVTILIGLLGYYYGDKIVTFDWDKYLSWALFVVIIISIVGIFFIRSLEDQILYMYIVSSLILVIFVLLLLSNHKKLKENSEKCVDGQMIPNYPLESWQIVIKIYQIFRSILNILISNRLRSGGRLRLR